MRKLLILHFLIIMVNSCTTDADCKSFYVCISDSCQHKYLFPNVSFTESFVGLIFIFTTLLTTVAGAGSFYSPILILIMNFTMKNSAPISITISFFILFVRNIFSLEYRNMHRRTPLINYDIVLVFSPPILMGTILGVIINTMSSTLLILVILILVMTTSIALTFQKGVELRREALSDKHEFIDLTEEAEIYLDRLKSKIEEMDEIYLREEKEKETTPEKRNIFKQYLQDNDQTPNKKQNSSLLVKHFAVPEVELIQVTTDNSYSYCLPLDDPDVQFNIHQLKRTAKTLESILKKECRLIDYEKVILVMINLCFVIMFTLFRGTDSVSSLIGVESCSTEFWILVFLYIPLGVVFMMGIVTYLIQEKQLKLYSGYVFYHDDLNWDLKTCVLIFLNGVGVGVVSSMIGMGGALLSAPMLFKLGVETQEASYTASFIAMFSAASSTVQYFIAGNIKWDYACFYLAFSMVGMLFGLKGVLEYLKNENMMYVICFALVAVSVMSLSFSIISNVNDLINNENSWYFHDFC